MIVVKRKENEKVEAMINRFNKLVTETKVKDEIRDRMYFKSNGDKKKESKKRKEKKIRRALLLLDQ